MSITKTRIDDQRTELGPHSVDDKSNRTYDYIEFEAEGRLKNVKCPSEIASKLEGCLKASGKSSVYLCQLNNPSDEVVSGHFIIAIAHDGRATYGVDMKENDKFLKSVGWLKVIFGIQALAILSMTLASCGLIFGLFFLPKTIPMVAASFRVRRTLDDFKTVLLSQQETYAGIPNLKYL